jgi:hypothetical protein
MTHAVVWIDHKEARIFHVHPEAADESRILSPQHHVHRPRQKLFQGERPKGKSWRGALIFDFRACLYGQGGRHVAALGLRNGSHALSLAGTGPRS